jgi:hypothetical protein
VHDEQRGDTQSERHRKKHASKRSGAIEIALQDDPVFRVQAYYDRERAFAQAKRLGVSWLRLNVLWAAAAKSSARRRTAPASPAYDWSAWDGAAQAARNHGVHVEMALTGPAPAWATGNGRIGPYRPDATLYAGFARAAALHFRGLVGRYSVWNEPNYVSWLSPLSAGPQLYRRLYEAGWSAIKGADPGAQVLIGETAPYAQAGRSTAPLAFLRGVTCATSDYRAAGGCTGLRAEGFAHHPYDYLEPPERAYPGADNVTIGTLSRLTGALDRLARAGLLSTPGGRGLPVYLTEFGYFARGRRALPAATRAEYLRRAFDIAARRYPRVRQLLQYLLVAPPRGYPGGRFDTSLLTGSGTPTASYDALAGWARRHVGSVAPH